MLVPHGSELGYVHITSCAPLMPTGIKLDDNYLEQAYNQLHEHEITYCRVNFITRIGNKKFNVMNECLQLFKYLITYNNLI